MTGTPARSRHVSTSEGAEILGIPASVIAKWKHRGKVVPVGVLHGQGRGGQVPLYRLAELEKLAAAYRSRVGATVDEE